MKVTKLIKEFVTEEVNKRYPIPKKVDAAAKFAYKELEERVMAFAKMEAEKFMECWVADIDKVGWGASRTDRCDEQKIKEFVKSIAFHSDALYYKADNDYKKSVEETEQKRANAIRSILVDLELGATKAELMELLANLPD